MSVALPDAQFATGLLGSENLGKHQTTEKGNSKIEKAGVQSLGGLGTPNDAQRE